MQERTVFLIREAFINHGKCHLTCFMCLRVPLTQDKCSYHIGICVVSRFLCISLSLSSQDKTNGVLLNVEKLNFATLVLGCNRNIF